MHALFGLQFRLLELGLLVLRNTAFSLYCLYLLHVVSDFNVLINIAFKLFLIFPHI